MSSGKPAQEQKKDSLEFIPIYSEDRDNRFGEYKLKDNVFWSFMEYFFIGEALPLREFMCSVEKSIIIKALSKSNGCQKKAAETLGVNYTTLNEKVKKYHIHFRKEPL